MLASAGTLAIAYCITILAYVATSPDIRIRCLLLDSHPAGLSADVHGIVIHKTTSATAVAPNLPRPRVGDVLTEIGRQSVRSFFDFQQQVAALRSAPLAENGQLPHGAIISELPDLPSLVQNSARDRWVEIKFHTRTDPGALQEKANAEVTPAAAVWSERTSYVLVQEIPPADIFLSLIWFLLQLAIFAVSGLAVWRRPYDGPARLFFAMCIVTLGAFVGGFHWWLVAGSPWLNTPFVLCGVLLPVVSLHFFLAYPRPRPPLSTHPRLTLSIGYGIPALAAVVMLVVLERSRWLSGTTGSDGPALQTMQAWMATMRQLIDLYLVFAATCFAAQLATLAHGVLATRHPIERNQLKWLLWAGLLAVVPVGYTLVLALFDDTNHRVEFALGWTARLSMFLASLAFLWAYAVGIIRFKLMLIDELVSRGVLYYLARVALALSFGLSVSVVWLVIDELTRQQDRPPGVQRILTLGTILVVIALILLWLRGRILQEVDRRFFREKYRLHTAMERINEAVVRVGDQHSLADRMISSCHDVFQVRSAAVYLIGNRPGVFQLAAAQGTPADDPPLQLALDASTLGRLQERSHILGPRQGGSMSEFGSDWPLMEQLSAELLFGLELDGELGVLVSLGSKPDETPYTAEDLTFLGALGQITSVALHTARVHQDVARLNDELQNKVETIAEQERRIAMMQAELATPSGDPQLRPRPDDEFRREVIIGNSPALRGVLEMVRKVAGSESSILIHGPSGTGKELLAQVIHENSTRREGPLVGVHCAALSPSLLESELFGHVRGAFTGAHRDRIGRFEMANGGTLFLDEIGDISLETQIKLLRVLQNHSFEPVGGTRTVETDVRLVTATHQDLKAMIEEGRFREDLYYRLNVISVELPSLAERHDDIVDLAVHFLQRSTRRLGREITNLDEAVVTALTRYDWPGNIRELENAIERAAVLTEGDRITLEDLPAEILATSSQPSAPQGPRRDDTFDFRPVSIAASGGDERQWLQTALQNCDGNKARAARELGMPRSTFFSKLKKHGLDRTG